MDPKLLKHLIPEKSSFKVWENSSPYLHNPWHFHPEIEITLIDTGKGTRFVGDNIQPYYDGDLVIIGQNLPHEWRSKAFTEKKDYSSRSLAIHFLKNFIGDSFYQLPETININHLLRLTKRGIKIDDGVIVQKIKTELEYLLKLEGLEKLIGLFGILNILQKAKNIELLASEGFIETFTFGDKQKINEVFQYVVKNFKTPISLPEVADTVNMTPNSFCRFFKKSTNKPFVQYLNEVRVGYACKVLVEGKLNICQTAYECGFNNLSNFNKHFKLITGQTPSEYLRVFRNKA